MAQITWPQRLLKLTKSLYPTGRAWLLPPGGVFERLHIALNHSEEDAYLDATGILDTILPDNNQFSVTDALEWETRLGLVLDPALPLVDRTAAILRKMNHPSDKIERQHYLFIERQLRLAGFKVWVYENRFDDGSGGYYARPLNKLIEDHQNPQYDGTFQHGQQQHGDWDFYERIVNHITNAEDAVVDVVNGRQTFIIGGDTVGKFAQVPATREKEIRQIVLNQKPVESAALLAISYGDGIYDTTYGALAPTGRLANTKYRIFGKRLYYQDRTTDSVRVWDVETLAELTDEDIGLGTLTTLRAFDIVGSKMYVLNNDGTYRGVRVFNMISGSHISGEDFGAGDISAAQEIFCFNGEAYVLDNTDQEIHVFNIATKALDRDIPHSTATMVDLHVIDDVLYVADSGTKGVYVYNALTGAEITNKTKVGGVITSASSLTIENGFLYLCDPTAATARAYDILTDNMDADTNEDLAGFAGFAFIAIAKDYLLWATAAGTIINFREKNV